MAEENLERINIDKQTPEKTGQMAESPEKPEQFFDREKISSDIEAARSKEILEKLSDVKTPNTESTAIPDLDQKKDKLVSSFIKEALFGKKNMGWVIKEVRKTNDPYIVDAFHDQLIEELKKFKENK
ncbi:MAG: hypothetical protein WC926_02900 [Candidatus Paceibacterota bacterium]|jgi:hypothetical protein